MDRKLRIQYPGAIYHVMNRGDRREAIFADDQDRERWLATLTEACAKTGWQVHAYCLMGNHFHLVIETPNLVVGMKWLSGTYTSRYNRRHKEFGHLFSGRYKALIEWGSEQTSSTFRCGEARGKAEIGKAESRNRNAEDRRQKPEDGGGLSGRVVRALENWTSPTTLPVGA